MGIYKSKIAFFIVLAMCLAFEAAESLAAGGYNSNGYQYAYNPNPYNTNSYGQNQSYNSIQQNTGYRAQQYQQTTPQRYAPQGQPQNSQITSEVVKRIYLTSDYIMQNPNRADFYITKLLGISTRNLDLNNIQRVAYSRNKTTLARELGYLFKNRQAIQAGTFNDNRYAIAKTQTAGSASASSNKINPRLTSGLSSWALGGLGVAAAGGLAAALAGGGGSSSTSSGADEGGQFFALKDSALCEPTLNTYSSDMCAYAQTACNDPQIQNTIFVQPFCQLTTNEVIEENTQNPTNTALQAFCAINPSHFLCTGGTESDYCGTGPNANPILCAVCGQVGSDAWLCNGGGPGDGGDDGGGDSGNICDPNSNVYNQQQCCAQNPNHPSCGNNGGGDGGGDGGNSCPPDTSQALCDLCQQYPDIAACEDFGDGDGGGDDGGDGGNDGNVCIPSDPAYNQQQCCAQNPTHASCGGNGEPDPRDPIADVGGGASDWVNRADVNRHPHNALVRLGAVHAFGKGVDGNSANTFLGVIDWFPSETRLLSTDPQYAWFRSMFDGRITEASLGSPADDEVNCSARCRGLMTIPGVSGSVTHGTVVAAWAAAGYNNSLNVLGYAPGAQDVRLRTTKNGSGTYAALDWAAAQTGGVGFFNNSWGGAPGGNYSISKLSQVLDQGHNLIFAAGNDGATSAAGTPARFATQASNATTGTGVMVSVVAVEPSGSTWRKASYSNTCGSSNIDYCISMPAGGPGSPIAANGTSFAAPSFSGASVLLHSGWNFLTGRQVWEILRDTATDIGAAGPDQTYGHGIVNLEKAFDPVGNPVVVTPGGLALNVNTSNASMVVPQNTPFGTAFSGIAATQQITFVDDYNRDFLATTLDDSINNQIEDEEELHEVAERMGTNKEKKATKVTKNLSLRLSSSNISQEDLENGTFEAFANYEINKSVSMNVGFTREVQDLFVGEDTAFNVNNFISPEVFELPYIQFAQEAKVLTTGIGYKFSDSLSTKITSLYSSDDDYASFAASMLEVGYKPTENLSFNFKQGMVVEFDTLFGTRSSGLLDVSNGTRTMFSGLDVNYDINSKWNLFASAYMGVTNADAGDRSLFSNVEDVITESYNIALTRKDLLGKDSLTFAMSQPLRVISGNANGVTFRVNHLGEKNVTGFSHDLSPNGRTIKFQTAYQKEIKEDLDMFVSAEVVKDDNHNKNNGTEFSVLGKMQYKF